MADTPWKLEKRIGLPLVLVQNVFKQILYEKPDYTYTIKWPWALAVPDLANSIIP